MLTERFRLVFNKFRDRLWVKPLAVCLLSVAVAFVAKFADGTGLAKFTPEVSLDSIEALLSIMASSMLVIATFSVSSMVSAYASAANTATPRSFTLVVSDDASQNALSTFVGAFIFSIVALTAVKNDYFERAGLFILFVLTAFIFGMVVVTFVRWVDRIARLGRMGTTIDKVENATAAALKRRWSAPHLCGVAVSSQKSDHVVYAANVGYVQYIDIAALQSWAEQNKALLVVAALPGTFATPNKALAYIIADQGAPTDVDNTAVAGAFQMGSSRLFDDDPRFGLVVLSEISGRALSPAVNDPGTAICIIGVLVRLFTLWGEPQPAEGKLESKYDRVAVPELSVRDMFDDAFTAIARDGAGVIEVAVRLQKALESLASSQDADIRQAAEYHSRLALKRAHLALNIAEDLKVVEDAADFSAKSAELSASPVHKKER
ncbi:Putative membrane protein [Rheinheimera sp. A13L]|uniref:DUF2254 domain-containing protein n=1 Tax=Rheinheimera sp. A13L TaxID=506534 RepID=UPI0002124B96|nr:DUF2254 domain-containing protein [Rheinheimera sp. A13L]EGM79035.1 Putative membrane protein [Rheinheimera sp. A13L]